MTKFEDTLKKMGDGISLSQNERAKMDRVIHEYIAMKPLATTRITTTSLSYSWFSLAYRPIAAALAVVMVFGSGISYAAEGALPGDVLYGVKTNINEAAKVALAGSAEAKAEVQIELAERRIEEATILASEGRLDEETENQLAVAFEAHAAAVAENMAEADKEDDSASTELASRFETRLLAHENILLEVESESDGQATHTPRLAAAIRTATEEALSASLGNVVAINVMSDTTTNAGEMENAGGAAASIEPAAATMMMTMTVANDASEPTPEPEARTAKMTATVSTQAQPPAPDAKKIARMKVAAEKSLKASEKSLKSAKSLSAEARAQAETDLSLAESLIAEGSQYLEADADFDAFNAFKESLRVSGQASVYMKAAPTLEKARSRARTIRANTNTSVDTQTDATVTGDPINATITLPLSEPVHDDGPSKELEEEKSVENTTKIQGTIKLDLSL